MSSGFKNLSTQMELSLTDFKPSSSAVPTMSVPSNTPPDIHNPPSTSGLSSSVFLFTRLPLAQLVREEYPNVNHWDSDDYNNCRKVGKKTKEEDLEEKKPKTSILSSYMEDEDGNEVPKKTMDAVRNMAKGFFSLILEKGRAPAKWGDASIDIENELIHMLESSFPFLRLCENHWKVKQVAKNSYSQWYPKALKRQVAAALAKKAADTASTSTTKAAEAIDVDADEDSQEESLKRPRAEDDETRRSKHPRTKESQSAPRPHPTKVTKQRQRVCRLFDYNNMCY